MRTLAVVLAAAASGLLSVCALEAAPYAAWAHSHWVWLDSSQSNQVNATTFVNDFFNHTIPVGATDIDSAWSTGFNNFVVDPTKFPDMGGFVSAMHAQNVKVILWATSMVDTDSSNFNVCESKNYYIRDGFNGTSLLKWWHGSGLLLDYTNPDARSWWEGQLDNVLSLGIDGWKTDGTDPYIIEYLVPHGASGIVTYQEYSNDYYGHFFNYTQQVNGDHCLIMSRPVDSYQLLDNSIGVYIEFSPKYVLFSGWVGDQDPSFEGLQNALFNMIHSAWSNYTGFGSDIGGYRSGPGPNGRTTELFMRWFELGAFLPLMENGGNNEHRPWMFDTPGSTFVTDTYRTYVSYHYELQPYLLTTGTQSYAAGVSIMRPTVPPPQNPTEVEIDINSITDFSYQLGPNYFVVPIYTSGQNFTNVTLPAGGSWFDFFQPNRTYPGGSRRVALTPVDRLPVFGLTGAIHPLHVSTPYAHNGDEASFGALTLLIHSPRCDGSRVTQEVREFKGEGATLAYVCTRDAADPSRASLRVSVSKIGYDIILLVRGVEATATTSVSTLAGAAHSSVAASSPRAFRLAEGAPHVLAKELPPSRTAEWYVTKVRATGEQWSAVGESVPANAVAPHWFAASSAVSASGAAEVFVRAGAADEGLEVDVEHMRLL